MQTFLSILNAWKGYKFSTYFPPDHTFTGQKSAYQGTVNFPKNLLSLLFTKHFINEF
jgi:hypothetical protein